MNPMYLNPMYVNNQNINQNYALQHHTHNDFVTNTVLDTVKKEIKDDLERSVGYCIRFDILLIQICIVFLFLKVYGYAK